MQLIKTCRIVATHHLDLDTETVFQVYHTSLLNNEEFIIRHT